MVDPEPARPTPWGTIITATVTVGALVAVAVTIATPSPDKQGPVVVAAERVIEAPAAEVWAKVIDIPSRSTWNPWIANAEPVGRSAMPALGLRYRATLALEHHQVPAELEIIDLEAPRRFSWRITLAGDPQLSNIIETVTLVTETERTTRTRYELRYEVHTAAARAAERTAVRPSLERLAEDTISLLRQRVSQEL